MSRFVVPFKRLLYFAPRSNIHESKWRATLFTRADKKKYTDLISMFLCPTSYGPLKYSAKMFILFWQLEITKIEQKSTKAEKKAMIYAPIKSKLSYYFFSTLADWTLTFRAYSVFHSFVSNCPFDWQLRRTNTIFDAGYQIANKIFIDSINNMLVSRSNGRKTKQKYEEKQTNHNTNTCSDFIKCR